MGYRPVRGETQRLLQGSTHKHPRLSLSDDICALIFFANVSHVRMLLWFIICGCSLLQGSRMLPRLGVTRIICSFQGIIYHRLLPTEVSKTRRLYAYNTEDLGIE